MEEAIPQEAKEPVRQIMIRHVGEIESLLDRARAHPSYAAIAHQVGCEPSVDVTATILDAQADPSLAVHLARLDSELRDRRREAVRRLLFDLRSALPEDHPRHHELDRVVASLEMKRASRLAFTKSTRPDPGNSYLSPDIRRVLSRVRTGDPELDLVLVLAIDPLACGDEEEMPPAAEAIRQVLFTWESAASPHVLASAEARLDMADAGVRYRAFGRERDLAAVARAGGRFSRLQGALLDESIRAAFAVVDLVAAHHGRDQAAAVSLQLGSVFLAGFVEPPSCLSLLADMFPPESELASPRHRGICDAVAAVAAAQRVLALRVAKMVRTRGFPQGGWDYRHNEIASSLEFAELMRNLDDADDNALLRANGNSTVGF